MTPYLATVPGHLLEEPKRALVFLLLGFILCFVAARLITRRARAGERDGQRSGSIVTPGGLHVHHSVFGIIGMIVFGILEFAMQPGSPLLEILAFAFGAGAALTLDEFALILHLEDVYWTGEGRQSIDAIILGGTFMTLLLTGLLPTSIVEVGDFITLSRWTAFALILSAAAFVIVSYLKGKPYMGTIGIFVLPVAVIGALRLARPGSPWAHFQYRTVPAKLERACQREEDLARWRERKYAVWDLIGGKPHLHLTHRDGRKRSGGAGHGGGSPDPRV
ncbi:MAG: hypothetical protein WCN81_16340 [Actinomycetes bacterium]